MGRVTFDKWPVFAYWYDISEFYKVIIGRVQLPNGMMS